MITIFAPSGIGEVTPQTRLAEVVLHAVAADPSGPLRDGDVVVVTSKILSKAEGRARPASERAAAVRAETRATVARRGGTAVVRTVTGLVTAAAGVDTSNVAPGMLLLLPVDPDASAGRLREELQRATGCRLAVVVSDTAGRPWRLGQTDHAVGSSGLRVLDSHVGRRDRYGNELRVTAAAVADEVAAAADLAKGKVGGRPVAVVRGLAAHLVDENAADTARDLVRPVAEDLFAYGRREAVLVATLEAIGTPERYEDLVALDGEDLVTAVTAGRPAAEADLLSRLLRAAAPPLQRPGAPDRPG
ncbi:MAG: coenzyme F420-0:L-glutamate ligase [Actinomycetes bacterium]